MRTKQTTRHLRSLRRRRLALALVGAMGMPVAVAQSLPSGGTVTSGSATITYGGSTTTINQSTQGAIINWGSFSIGSGYGVTFNQPNANSVVLNRVVGFGYGAPAASVINGSLSANGHVFIVNPSGITFNSTGSDVVNVAGLVASTIDISDANFNAGVSSRVFNFDGSSAGGQVANYGSITTAAGGRVAFLAPGIYNSGAISANDGSVAFGAASTVTLDLSGDGLTQITLNSLAASTVLTQISNVGTIAADGGQILMRALSDPTGNGGTIRAGGVLRARSMVNNAGSVELVSEGGDVILAGPEPVIIAFAPVPGNAPPGAIDVSSTGGAGGSVSISGNNVLLYRNPTSGLASSIDASGATAGGSVSINAATDLQMDPDVVINANATAGPGGTVELVSGRSLAAFGSLSARGSSSGGNILTSTGDNFDIRGLSVDAGGAVPGTWTLSAPDLNVVAGAAAGTPSTITLGRDVQDAEINRALDSGTSVTLRAGTVPSDFGDIYFNDGVDIFYDDGAVPLLLRADAQGSIAGANFSIGSNAAPLAMAFNADANNLNNGFGSIDFFNATLDSNGGDIQFYGQSDTGNGVASSYDSGVRIADSRISSGGGTIVIRGASTGSDAGPDAAGVAVTGTAVDAGAGGVIMFGSGEAGTAGVIVDSSPINAGAGGVAITGQSTESDGILVGGGDITTTLGDISLVGTGGTRGVAALGGLYSNGGDIRVDGTGVTTGVVIQGDSVDSNGGAIGIVGTASAPGATGVSVDGASLTAGAGDVTIDGSAPLGIGVLFANGAGVATTAGAITLIGEGANFGLDIADGAIDTDSGDITLTGDALAAAATAGVRVTGGGLSTNGGSITVTGTSAGGVGVQLGDGGAFAIGSGGGAISINGSGVTTGVRMEGNSVDSGGGVIDVIGAASGSNGIGVDLANAQLVAGAGDVRVFGNAAAGTGVNFAGQSQISTTTGALAVTGIGLNVGLSLTGGLLSTDSGHFDLRGRGMGAASSGLVIGQGVSIVTNGGGVELAGEGGSGAGIDLQGGSRVDADNSLVVVRAGNDGSSDAIRIGGTIASATAVNLRPGGVDANGGLTERVNDTILLGGGSAGFVLGSAELARISAPQLVIGSNLHAGSIQVLGATSRTGNLTLQNDGGTGGIDIQATLDVGSSTLALSSGGDISQTSAGAITAHSLLARAGGNVLLANAGNNVAANTLAGSAGGDFEYLDVDALAIGTVSASGFDASTNALSVLSASGISAGGDVFVRNQAGDLTLNANVTGADIDLVTANTLQNPAGASLVASGDWRVWANTWVGETRGGLAGDGNLPNLYGCTFQGPCGVTVPTADNHFIYVQQPTAIISFANTTREYGLPNPALSYTVSGAILGDTVGNVATGTATTTATIGSNVGNYPIIGNFSSAAGYRLQFVPGTLAITPATLLFTADSFVRYLGTENPLFTGTVSGFRNGDTVASVFGTGVVWSSPAGILTPIGFYPINGGTTATNYVFSQAPGNATALQIIPLPQLSSTPIDLIRETVNTYVYDRNFGGAPMCAVNASLADQQLASAGDELSNEWSKVRSRPNLTNCFDSERKSSCGDF